MRKRNPESSRDRTRARLVAVAAELLATQGPDAVTTRSVALAAGVQAPTIYRLFGDKSGLLDAVVEHGFAGYLARKPPADAEADPIAGLRAVLEFFPWTVVPDLDAAVQMVEAAGRTEIGILVDTLHFDRSGSRVEQLDRIPPARLPFVHVCDAPVQDTYTTEELLHAGRAERLPPGEGAIDIGGILRHMPQGIPVALEVPMTTMSAAEGAEAVALRLRQASERLLTV